MVFLLGVDGLLECEADPRLDDSASAELAADHTRLLYMACTRAARRLVIMSKRWPQEMSQSKERGLAVPEA